MTEPSKGQVIFVDDDVDVLIRLGRELESQGFDVRKYESARVALKDISPDFSGVVLTDLKMEPINGKQFMFEIHKMDVDIPVIMLTGHTGIEIARETRDCIKSGVYDFVFKPIRDDLGYIEFYSLLSHAIEKRRLILEYRRSRGNTLLSSLLIGNTPQIVYIRELIMKVYEGGLDRILVTGETGTGKSLVAKCFKKLVSEQAQKCPFVEIHIEGMDSSIARDELFGHKKGAYTGAFSDKPSPLEKAEGGIVFIDEVGELDNQMQKSLLHFAQTGEFRRTGDTKIQKLNKFRLISATNVDLEEAMNAGVFRRDLYERLNTIPIELPPLRDRKEDIPLLFKTAIESYCEECQMNDVPELNDDIVSLIKSYQWPGNVRELFTKAKLFCIGLLYDADPFKNETVQKEEVIRVIDNLEETAQDIVKRLIKNEKNKRRKINHEWIGLTLSGLVYKELITYWEQQGLDSDNSRRKAWETLGENNKGRNLHRKMNTWEPKWSAAYRGLKDILS